MTQAPGHAEGLPTNLPHSLSKVLVTYQRLSCDKDIGILWFIYISVLVYKHEQ